MSLKVCSILDLLLGQGQEILCRFPETFHNPILQLEIHALILLVMTMSSKYPACVVRITNPFLCLL